jgi:hypothetical protein
MRTAIVLFFAAAPIDARVATSFVRDWRFLKSKCAGRQTERVRRCIVARVQGAVHLRTVVVNQSDSPREVTLDITLLSPSGRPPANRSPSSGRLP